MGGTSACHPGGGPRNSGNLCLVMDRRVTQASMCEAICLGIYTFEHINPQNNPTKYILLLEAETEHRWAKLGSQWWSQHSNTHSLSSKSGWTTGWWH